MNPMDSLYFSFMSLRGWACRTADTGATLARALLPVQASKGEGETSFRFGTLQFLYLRLADLIDLESMSLSDGTANLVPESTHY